ncbi:MAG TPA: hypothetical protein VIF15_03620 [Polyangiaceae bacterium]|jgi:hypothetical protein
MKRLLASALLACAVGLALGACDDRSNAGSYPSGGPSSVCTQYTTCGSCTPVSGCGWCFNALGGSCQTDPDQCTNVSEFTWTWDSAGCPGVDASVVPLDAGTTTGHEAGAVPEAGEAGDGASDASGNPG